MPRESEREGNRRVPAVRRNGDAAVNRMLDAALAGDLDAAHDAAPAALVHERPPHGDRWLESGARRDGALQERPVDVAPNDGPPGQASRISAIDRNAVLAGETHAIDGQPALVNAGGEAEPPQQRERSRVDRIAAQLVARKCRPVDDAHAGARAREHRGGHRAGRTRADDDDIIHG